MLHEAKEGLSDGIFIRFRTDGSLFNLHIILLVETKVTEQLIIDLLFTDDCAFLPHSMDTLLF